MARWWRRLRRRPKDLWKRLLPPNLIIDRAVRPASREDLGQLGVAIDPVDLSMTDHAEWVERYVPDWRTRFGDLRHKKLLEFAVTARLLDPRPEHAFLDAAGGIHTYLGRLACERRYMQDVQIPTDLRRRLGDRIAYLECDAAAIPLPPESLDRISCHHSFEHFQQASDTGFVREAQRLLRPGGRCVIVPLFVGNRYLEVTDALTLRRKFDPRSRRVIDPTASIPGGPWCGNYARIYDAGAVRDRLLAHVEPTRFTVSVLRVTLEGKDIPDLTLPCHRRVTAINRPVHALLLERRP